MEVREKKILGEYSFEKSGRTDGNMFYTIVRGNEWKCYTKFFSGSVEVTTFSGGYKSSSWLR